MILSNAELKWIRDQAVLTLDSPHIDLSHLLGVATPVCIGLDDVHELLKSGEPSFSLELGDSKLTVRRQDGGMLAELEIKF